MAGFCEHGNGSSDAIECGQLYGWFLKEDAAAWSI